MGKDENRLGGKLQSVLFVCTGKPQSVHAWVQTRLCEKGADPTAHVQRQLTKELVEAADLVIAMGRDHQVFVREQFGRDGPLFNQVCLGHDKPILDLHEVMPDWEIDPEWARAYVWPVIDVI